MRYVDTALKIDFGAVFIFVRFTCPLLLLWDRYDLLAL